MSYSNFSQINHPRFINYLLPCFQFSVFSFSKNKLNLNGPYILSSKHALVDVDFKLPPTTLPFLYTGADQSSVYNIFGQTSQNLCSSVSTGKLKILSFPSFAYLMINKKSIWQGIYGVASAKHLERKILSKRLLLNSFVVSIHISLLL